MALASLNGIQGWPDFCRNISAAPSVTNRTTCDAAGEYECVVNVAREAMTISHVGFRVSSATGSPTADVRVETVDTAGLPSGTLFGTNTNAVSGTLTNGWNLVALTASASISVGQAYAVKIVYNSGTSFIVATSGAINHALGLPYYVTNTGTPTKGTLNPSFLCALGSSTTTFYGVRGLHPIVTPASNTFNNTSSARRGLRFQIPFKCRCVGIRYWNSTSTGDFNVAMFDDAGSELSSSSTAYDGDLSLNAAAGVMDLMFDNPVTLSPGTWYRAAIEPSSATNVTIHTLLLPSSSYRSAMPHGSNAHYTTYVASSWTDTATDTIPLMDILIDQLDDGASAGAGLSRARAFAGMS